MVKSNQDTVKSIGMDTQMNGKKLYKMPTFNK